MDELQLTTMPFIILTVYIITWVLKCTVLRSDNRRKHLPPIAMMIGGIIAVAIFFYIPSAATFENVIEAATTGMGSGLAAVGCNQIYKQYARFNTVKTLDKTEDEI